MKKVLLTAVAIFGFGFANAQEVKFGIKAGVNMATLTGDSADNLDSKIGFHVGGFAEFKVSEKFSVQPEVLFSTQGAKADGGSLDINYINIPVMAKFYATPEFSLEAGPQLGFLVSAESNPDSGSSTDVKEFLKSTDFGVNLGAGYQFTENFSAGLRYNLGLSNMAEEENVEFMNSVFSLSLGYRF